MLSCIPRFEPHEPPKQNPLDASDSAICPLAITNHRSVGAQSRVAVKANDTQTRGYPVKGARTSHSGEIQGFFCCRASPLAAKIADGFRCGSTPTSSTTAPFHSILQIPFGRFLAQAWVGAITSFN